MLKCDAFKIRFIRGTVLRFISISRPQPTTTAMVNGLCSLDPERKGQPDASHSIQLFWNPAWSLIEFIGPPLNKNEKRLQFFKLKLRLNLFKTNLLGFIHINLRFYQIFKCKWLLFT